MTESKHINFREGDIYTWGFKPDHPRVREFGSTGSIYWCMACIGIVKNGVLVDTYWHGSDNRAWTPEKAEQELELNFKGNLDELESYGADAYEHFDTADIVDIRHANDRDPKLVYVRKGATRSADVMRRRCEYIIERSQSDIRFAQNRIERCKEKLAEIDAGKLDGYLPDYSGH